MSCCESGSFDGEATSRAGRSATAGESCVARLVGTATWRTVRCHDGNLGCCSEVDLEGSECEQVEQFPSKLGHRDGDDETPAENANEEHERSDNEDESRPVHQSPKHLCLFVSRPSERAWRGFVT